MSEKYIRGIQQVGIGVNNVAEAWKWYREAFGVDIRIFEEEAIAGLMLPYTGGKPQKRHAALAMNMQGGGGFEIWNYKDRIPQQPAFDLQMGDLGIFSVKIKSMDVHAAFELHKKAGLEPHNISKDPGGKDHYFLQDPYGNYFEVVPCDAYFMNENKPTGAVFGVTIGVTDIEKALPLYSKILGYNKVVYDKTGNFEDLTTLPGGKGNFRRILLNHSDHKRGSFSKLLGPTQLELIQSIDRPVRKIYENRFWGDLGFIHLCFDVSGMRSLREECRNDGFAFTVDSIASHDTKGFDMGEAAGHFAYIADPDGTLIEFVETLKVPVFKKFGIYLNLKKRHPHKSLPDFIVKALRFNRFKESNG
ncbi:MAG: VOC family protein [Bacteroidales bacterium]|nr:VOC family protein [Bacteroidales bacterium]